MQLLDDMPILPIMLCMMRDKVKLNVMVLAGGPDSEREVSLASGKEVAAALKQGGHEVRLRDALPDDLSALDEFAAWEGAPKALFPAMHGPWGEGGGLQTILDARGLPYFGCRADAAALCMDKQRTKEVLINHGLPTPAFETVDESESMTLKAPVVIKPLCEGSSIGVAICPSPDEAMARKEELVGRYGKVLVEQFVTGMEVTVAILGGEKGDRALPPMQIMPAAGFYDYEAKYQRDDTRYRFDAPLPEAAIEATMAAALKAHEVLGCRHLSRVDMIVDESHQPWILEVNTIPGFTSHSLVPKAAAHAGIGWPELCDRLVRLGLA